MQLIVVGNITFQIITQQMKLLRSMFTKISYRCIYKVIKLKHVILLVILLVVLYVLGILTHLFETDFYRDFHYPYDGDIEEDVYALRNNKKPSIQPINYDYNSYKYIISNRDRCNDPEQQIRVVFLIKSAPQNAMRRDAIRASWGFEKRFSDVQLRRLFLIGYRKESQDLIYNESQKYSDIIQWNFTDSYYNNTIKTMLGFQWVATYCSDAKFYMLVDDDYYVSVKNLLRYLRNPINYPKYLQEAISSLKNALIKRQIVDYELPDDVKLYSGFVFNSSPHRHIFSKWYISLEEYPYSKWPPYVTAGAVVLSREAILDMYYTSFYTKAFRFDDIYMGILALKAKIIPYHSSEFHFYKQDYTPQAYTFTVASHGYQSPTELLKVWTEQKSIGNA